MKTVFKNLNAVFYYKQKYKINFEFSSDFFIKHSKCDV